MEHQMYEPNHKVAQTDPRKIQSLSRPFNDTRPVLKSLIIRKTMVETRASQLEVSQGTCQSRPTKATAVGHVNGVNHPFWGTQSFSTGTAPKGTQTEGAKMG